MRELLANVTAFLREDGHVVPGSIREGHNILTRFGAEWLAQLCAWSTLGAGVVHDTPLDSRRVRWASVGTGVQLEAVSIAQMVAPSLVSGSDYLDAIDPGAEVSWPVPSSKKLEHVFGTADLPDPVTVTEAALFVDFNDGGTILDPAVATNPPIVYKVISPALVKDSSKELVLRWELRF